MNFWKETAPCDLSEPTPDNFEIVFGSVKTERYESSSSSYAVVSGIRLNPSKAIEPYILRIHPPSVKNSEARKSNILYKNIIKNVGKRIQVLCFSGDTPKDVLSTNIIFETDLKGSFSNSKKTTEK